MEAHQKWVLITGALGGIGKALVREYANSGYVVLASDIKQPEMEGAQTTEFIQLDLQKLARSELYANRFYEQVQKITKNGGISALVNNAATQILGNCKSLDRRSWQESFDVNLTAPFFLSQLFLEDLEKNRGSIVNISSIHATQTKKKFVAYATTKAGLSAMTRNMVLDVGDKVRINAIEPAAIATEMLKESFVGEETKYRQLEDFHPLGRIGLPEEVAAMAVFLSSDKAEFVQGACISVSGGISGCLSDPV
jgi:NAD(P)-dependent dehydrogenase (short-subunit alcohol dehydrogenase family)